MKVSLYKILAVKNSLESLNLMAIPEMKDDDIESMISIIIVGLSDRPDDFNNLISTISEEKKIWAEDIMGAIGVLRDFFTLIPGQLNVLISQLRSVSNTLENAVMKMMKEEMIEQIAENPDKEVK